MDVDRRRRGRDKQEFQLVGVPVKPGGSADLVKTNNGSLDSREVEVDVRKSETSSMKRKRGRPPRGQARTTPLVRKKKDEEDVCFICFDGGSLVLCDRRACPKAYHPSCIKRDESFFRSRAKWTCGWHICSKCQKAAHYLCYTCTYSLCKGCTKDADYVCVRGNFGFCGTCMRTIMLIEKSALGEKFEVDFDDKSSWEYLFKVYWVYTKSKLSLTLDELNRGQSPWKRDLIIGSTGETSSVLYHGRDENCSIQGNSCLNIEIKDLKRRKTLDHQDFVNENSTCTGKFGFDEKMPLPESTNWASKELMKFVGHVKTGYTSVLSRFDVHGLLLEYIEKNNLRDPCQKCEVLCDRRLKNLFGKTRVSHVEVPKLLELHFLIKENVPGENNHTMRILDTVASQGKTSGLSDDQLMIDIDKKNKPCEMVDVQVTENDLNTYEATDSHNVKLIYLRRSQMENLVEDTENFHQKVLGSIVRIKIPNGDRKTDKYRLVLVAGTRKVAQQYKIGTGTTNVMLEIINVNKKEVISIDGISNQEFSGDECRRFRRSVKSGLSKYLTVETGKLGLTHLCDRACEKGHQKESRDCAQKFLSSNPEDEQQRLHEIPAVNSDLNKDPSYESDDDDDDDAGELNENKKDDNFRSNCCGLNREERQCISPRSRDYDMTDVRTRENETSAASYDQLGGNPLSQSGTFLTAQGTGDSSNAVEMTSNVSSPLVASEISPMRPLDEAEQSINDFGTDNVWHYQYPSGKTQGPFSSLQLCEGNTTRHLPPELRIWRTDESEDCSVLLRDALNSKCQENILRVTISAVHDDDDDDGCKIERISSINRGNIEGSEEPKLQNGRPHHGRNDESVRSNEWNFDASCDGKIQDFQPLPSTTFTPGHRKEGSRININSDEDGSDQNLIKTQESCVEQGLPKQSVSDGHSGNSSEHNWTPPPVSTFSNCMDFPVSKTAQQSQGIRFSDLPTLAPVNSSSDCWDSRCNFASVRLDGEIDFSELPSPDPTQNNVATGQACEKNSQSSNIAVNDTGSSWSTASSLVSDPLLHPEVVEGRDYSPMPTQPSVEEWDSSFVSASSLGPTEIATDHAVTPSSISCQQPHSSPSEPTYNNSDWQVIINDSNDFSSLVDESVSDLLAEVEAMESRGGGVDTPTSIMNYGEELTDGSKKDCLSSADGLSPMPDLGKGDALSSTADAQLPTYTSPADKLQYQMTGAHSGVGMKKSDPSFQQGGASANMPVSVPHTTNWEVAAMDMPWKLGSDSTSTLWGTTQGNLNLSWSTGLADGNSNLNWGFAEGAMQDNGSISSCTATGNPGFWESQTWEGSDRISSSRNPGFHGRNYGSDRGRTIWQRQPSFDTISGTASHRQAARGQIVCKYYLREFCNKGGSCSHWHP